MNNICLRKIFEQNTPFLNNSFRTKLVLLGCDVCKKMENEEKINKYEKLFIMPVLISQRTSESPLIRMAGCMILEDLANEFDNANDKEAESFLKNLELAAKHQKQFSNQWLDGISEGTYCKIIAYLYWMQCYNLIFFIGMQYIFNRAKITGSSVRTNWYYKNEEKPFFQIGIALDEGIVQTLTEQMMTCYKDKEFTKEKRKMPQSALSSAYFFEMKFVDKIIDSFKLDKKKFLESSFTNNCLNFLVEETEKNDCCDLYRLLLLSDQCRWKEVNGILKKYRR